MLQQQRHHQQQITTSLLGWLWVSCPSFSCVLTKCIYIHSINNNLSPFFSLQYPLNGYFNYIYTLIIPEYNNNIIGSYMHFLLQTQNISLMKRIIITFPHSIAFTPELHFLTHSSRENRRESGEKRLTKINISLMVRFCVIVISFSPQITTYYSYHSHSWKGLLTPYMYECVYVMLLMNVSFYQPQILQQKNSFFFSSTDELIGQSALLPMEWKQKIYLIRFGNIADSQS